MLHRYFYQFWTVLLLCVVVHTSHGQTTLLPGDLVIIGANSTDLSTTDPDNFSFAPLVDLAAGTQIFFTDNGWQAAGGFRATEGTVTYTAPAGGIRRGRIVTFSTWNHPDFTATKTFLLAVEGDQILAYQGNSTSPRFIYGLTLRKPWSDATSSNTSAVPTGLQDGVTAVAAPWCNAYMYQIALRRGLTATVGRNFTNASNWTGNNSTDPLNRVTWPLTDLILEGVVPDTDELQALQALYNGNGGASWSTRTNWPTSAVWPATLSNVDFAHWFGVSMSNGDVSGLNLSNNRLTGSLPTLLNKLLQLNTLTLTGNQLAGTVPAELAQLTQLQYLRLKQNQLSAVPQALAQLPLRTFDLSSNKLNSLPNFSQKLPASQGLLTIDVANNAIGFGPLEANLLMNGQMLLAGYNWANQMMPGGEDTETQTTAEPLVLTCSFSGTRNSYQWGKYTGSNWNAITGATGVVFRINSPARSDAGRYACRVTNAIVTNLTLESRTTNVVINASTTPAPPTAAPADDFNRNWTIERTYDGEGNLVGNILAESKQFTDGLGRGTQAQARSRANLHVFASETIYDREGQPVVQTLAAPTNNQGFAYKEGFTAITNGTGNKVEYSPANFEDTSTGNPDGLNVQDLGTLGYYYSTANELEPLTPVTAYPFSLTVPAKGPLGGLKRAGSPGEAFQIGSGHEAKGREIPLLKEFDDYMSLRHHFVQGSSNLVTLQRQGTKTIGVDADGRESVVVSNREGQALISCLTGAQYPPKSVSGFISTDDNHTYEIGAPRLLDIHIPATGEHQLDFTIGGQVRILNLNGGPGVSLTRGSGYTDSVDVTVVRSTGNTTRTSVYLLPGFYRLISRPSTSTDPDEKTQWFNYAAEYGNFNYTFYDDAGRAVATVAPNGLAGNNLVKNPSFDLEVQATAGQYWNTAQYWQTDGAIQTAFTESYGGGHTGALHETHYSQSGGPYQVTTHQQLTNIANGKYTLRAWVKGSGGQNIARVFARNYGGSDKAATIGATAGGSTGAWTLVQVDDIQVSNGQCDVGFESNATASGQFIYVDDIAFARAPDSNQPDFVTRNTYDTSDRLLATESTDDGRSEYVYARDGRIRFSQSALQRPSGRFSYSNYDEVGRVVESGEYTPSAAGPVFQSQLPASTMYRAQASTDRGGGVQVLSGGGTSFVGSFNQPGAYLAFNVSVPTTGTYAVRIRYAAGANAFEDRTMPLYLQNSQSSGYLYHVTFPATNSWSTWEVQTLQLNLAQGSNRILFQQDSPNSNSTHEGYVNFDYCEVISEQAMTTASVLNLLEERVPTNSLLAANCRQRSFVTYDRVFTGTGPTAEPLLAGRIQEFTNGAVTKTWNDQVTTWYSYDELGRVTWMVQNITGVGAKALDYTYDYAGNVLEVAYQKGQPDAFHHYYEYDQGQRLYKVYTSADGTERALQAKYFYYLHGPLKRVELANGLQGVDYTYTLQGWLKTINHVNGRLDPGGDSPTNNGVAKDLFGLTLDYFSGDYQSRAQAALNLAGASTPARPFRYDGTIRTASWRAGNAPAHQSVYDYDAKSQLSQSNFGALTIAGAPTASTYQVTPTQGHKEGGLSYDANGNMQSLRRTDGNGVTTDNFSYEYAAGTNRLSAVHGGGSPSGSTIMDYDYDAVGQMTRQHDEAGQRYYTYDVAGKTTGVYFDAARTQAVVEFAYDDRGFRVSKKSFGTGANANQTSMTYYVRDAGGNLLSIYEQGPQTGNHLQRSEVPLYGSGRVGVLTHLDDGTATGTDDARYELNDHLGDARVVFHRPTTQVMETDAEPSTSQSDSQWPGLVQARQRTSPLEAHSGEYVAYVPAAPVGGHLESVHRTIAVLRGDTISFSAWARIFAVGQPQPRAAQLRILPVITFGQGAAPTDKFPGTAARPGLLNRLSAGIALTGWGGKAVPNGKTLTTAQVWIRYRVLDESLNQVAEHYEYYANTGQQAWVQLQTGVRVDQAGSIDVMIGSDDPDWQAYFDDLRLEQTGGLIVQEQHQYAYGSPLVGLNYVVGAKRYRYGYQGQYAEKDAETGFESFELRLYNARIGRWTSGDPEGQFSSPYSGMGNNPVSGIDSDGGWAWFGAIAGASVGAGIGYATTGTWKGAAIGAGAGFLAGGLLGPKLDVEKAYGRPGETLYSLKWQKVQIGNGWKNLEWDPSTGLGKIGKNALDYGAFFGKYSLYSISKGQRDNENLVGAHLEIANSGRLFQTVTTNTPSGMNRPGTPAPRDNVPNIDGDTRDSPLFDSPAGNSFFDIARRPNDANPADGVINFTAETSKVRQRLFGGYKVVKTITWGFSYDTIQKVYELKAIRFHTPSQGHLNALNSWRPRR